MSTIDIDKTKSKYVTSCQQTQLSGTSKIIFTNNTIRNDISPETIFKTELHRRKQYENHLAILNLHKERNSYPSALSSMPQPTIGNDDNDFIKEWNELLNDSRRNLMNKTTEYMENNLIEINGKIESDFEFEANDLSKSTIQASSRSDSPSLGTAIVNTQILTIFKFEGNQVYVYSALSNENENLNSPQKWIFYFVPIMLPESEDWVTAFKSEVRVTLMLGNDEVEEIARKAIIEKYDLSVSQYSKFWTVAPLMIDSLMSYIVKGSNSPVEGVHPHTDKNPNKLSITFRFKCSTEETAKEIVQKIIDSDYEIEIASYFAGFKQVSTNFVSINSDQLKSVISKTIADGGNKNAEYVHKSDIKNVHTKKREVERGQMRG
ncbi:unnamed protein product [Didymodactylos carnosus]|uniref:Uncharacterized protein n=1 Tax=Didymodactylos carnosus TaxID=1234261 RepID=A0A814HZF7_9BILA|nr:unnamed protein product [Didymodactylos carnosus]CAF3787704.1 unnamed protein product [Didymodactylos carnosus]